MSWLETWLLACVLAVDAFSVGVVVGLRHRTARQVLRLSFHFGLFQALFPLIGAGASHLVLGHIQAWDHWLVFIVFGVLGMRMLIDAFRGKSSNRSEVDLTKGARMIALSTAVSIDALAAGVLIEATQTPLIQAVLIIGLVAGVATALAMIGANRLPERASKRLEAAGGIILILMGMRTLLVDLGVIG